MLMKRERDLNKTPKELKMFSSDDTICLSYMDGVRSPPEEVRTLGAKSHQLSILLSQEKWETGIDMGSGMTQASLFNLSIFE